MSNKTEKNSYTIIFAVVMVVIVGSLLAGFASGLKPLIKANERYEKQQNILYALGVHDNTGEGDVAFISTDKVEGVFSENITEQIVLEYKDGKVIKEMTREQFMDTNNGLEPYLINVKKEQTKQKNGGTRFLPLFVGTNNGTKTYVMPVRGKGLWDAIWGFVAVDKDMVVQGVYFDHKGETPGLGAEIKQRFFMDDFKGEHMLDGSMYKGIAVAKGNNDPVNTDKKDYEVDAIAGATITGDGVSAMLKKDIKMYVPYFQGLK